MTVNKEHNHNILRYNITVIACETCIEIPVNPCVHYKNVITCANKLHLNIKLNAIIKDIKTTILKLNFILTKEATTTDISLY